MVLRETIRPRTIRDKIYIVIYCLGGSRILLKRGGVLIVGKTGSYMSRYLITIEGIGLSSAEMENEHLPPTGADSRSGRGVDCFQRYGEEQKQSS